jgi:NADPH:quinone reductase-like Zn-dependent oxidoreductase
VSTKSRRIGTTTLRDSLDCAKQRGIVCITVTVGDKWSFDDFNPMDVISTSVCLTTYDGFHADTARRIGRAGRSTLRVQIGRVFKLDDIVEAHRCMEENKAGAKIVVLT